MHTAALLAQLLVAVAVLGILLRGIAGRIVEMRLPSTWRRV